MKLTNDYNLPDAVLKAIANDSYDDGGADITASQLATPIKLLRLKKKYEDQLTEDASDRTWSLLGQGCHYALQQWASKDDIVEKRLFARMDGRMVSGQFDLLSRDNNLYDYKITSVWNVKDVLNSGEPKFEWIAQMNALRWLIEKNPNKVEGRCVDRMFIIAFCRDWRQGEALKQYDYPKRVELISIPIWSVAKTENYIHDRLTLLFSNGTTPIPDCTPEERWAHPTRWAVMKKNRKTALKLFDDINKAEDCLRKEVEKRNDNNFTDYYVEIRKGRSARCDGYCPVNRWCDQYKKEQEGLA